MAEQIHKGPPFGHTILIEFWPTPITHPFRSEEKGKVAAFLPPPQSSHEFTLENLAFNHGLSFFYHLCRIEHIFEQLVKHSRC